MPMVPAPKTMAFSPSLGRERLAARVSTVKGPIMQAASSGMDGGIRQRERSGSASGIRMYSEKAPRVPAREGSFLAGSE